MHIRLLNLAIISVFGIAMLASCSNSNSPTEETDIENNQTTSIEQNATTNIDWSTVASGEQAVDRSNYDYPFAIDSQNVQDYADYFKVDKATAQHNLTLSMASNEALSKVLDQIGEHYTSHELTDGKDMTLIIHTTPDIEASRYDYVFGDDFAKGLVLPIVIQPDAKKSERQPHSEIQGLAVVEE